MTVEQLADACVVLEELHQNFDDADWLWEQITLDIHNQFEAFETRQGEPGTVCSRIEWVGAR